MSFWDRLLHRWAANAGYELTSQPPKSERLDIHLQRLFQKLNINCIFDVGANRGQYGRFLRQSGYTGRIISFEPVSADFALLQAQAADDPEWQTHQIALGREENTAEINVTSDSLFNSFLKPNEFIRGQGLRISHVESVQIRPLDALFDQSLAEINQPQPYLKLDTQGYDLEVLAGAEKCLSRISALQTELSIKPVYEQMPYYLDSIAHLEKMGFEVTGLFPIARDNALRVVELDCVMVRSAAAGQTTCLYPA
ncbi:MAG: FkbM family methyltransferase [Candidatus Promineifilaceae bacterium]